MWVGPGWPQAGLGTKPPGSPYLELGRRPGARRGDPSGAPSGQWLPPPPSGARYKGAAPGRAPVRKVRQRLERGRQRPSRAAARAPRREPQAAAPSPPRPQPSGLSRHKEAPESAARQARGSRRRREPLCSPHSPTARCPSSWRNLRRLAPAGCSRCPLSSRLSPPQRLPRKLPPPPPGSPVSERDTTEASRRRVPASRQRGGREGGREGAGAEGRRDGGEGAGRGAPWDRGGPALARAGAGGGLLRTARPGRGSSDPRRRPLRPPGSAKAALRLPLQDGEPGRTPTVPALLGDPPPQRRRPHTSAFFAEP